MMRHAAGMAQIVQNSFLELPLRNIPEKRGFVDGRKAAHAERTVLVPNI